MVKAAKLLIILKLQKVPILPDHTLPKKILYVDDNPVTCQLISFVMKQHGFQTKTAKDGREGVDLALSWLPHLILMDLMMPVMDGFQASRLLRTHPETQEIPIVAFSSTYEAQVEAQILAAGMNGFIPKTLPVTDLLAALQLYLP